jgi:plasmid replication initiation protein
MAFIAEHEIKDGSVDVFVGPKMFSAIRNRESFTRVREASLFAMRGTKYSSRLYVLIRDKANLKIPKWEVSVDEFRNLMQVIDGVYPEFAGLRRNVIDPAIDELNKESELDVSWRKGHTFKNRVKTIVFEWKIRSSSELRKTAKESARHSKAKNKPAGDGDAPPIVITARAAKWLADQPWDVRNSWWERARALGAPDLAAATAVENLAQWVNWVARLMVQEGVISDQP